MGAILCQRAPAEAGSIPKESRPGGRGSRPDALRKRAQPSGIELGLDRDPGTKSHPCKQGRSIRLGSREFRRRRSCPLRRPLPLYRPANRILQESSEQIFSSAPVSSVIAKDFIYVASRSGAFKRNIDRSRSFSLYISVRTEAFADVCWVACSFKKCSTYRSEFFRRRTPALERRPYVGHRSRSCKPLPLRHATPPGRDRQRS
jgi:hypothetical protein